MLLYALMAAGATEIYRVGGIQAIGIDQDGKLVIKTAPGDYLTDENFIEWTPAAASNASWASATPPEPELVTLTLMSLGLRLMSARVLLMA